jgi:ATP-dependent DNA helicase RecG
MQTIDLKELSKRESERVEWKEGSADIDGIIKTAVAFANDFSNLGGGYIVCGAREEKDEFGFQKLVENGISASVLKQIEGKVMTGLREKTTPPIVPLLEEKIVADGKRILIFIIPASKNAHSYRADGKDSSAYYVRIGRETREARNGLYRELLIQKNELEPWDLRPCRTATSDDIDLVILREYLKNMKLTDKNKAVEEYLSETERISVFSPSLIEKERLTGMLRPRNFSLLLFTKEPLKYFDGAYALFSVYAGTDRSSDTALRHEITGNIVNQIERCIELANTYSYTVFNKLSELPNQVKYPKRALQEAIVNCFAHRDYQINQPSRITVFSDRIEIYSPGSLPRTVEINKFIKGKTAPYWRNQSLAYFFNKLNLAQAEGQGIPTIFKTMKDEGCPEPVFEIGPESVTCILYANPEA